MAKKPVKEADEWLNLNNARFLEIAPDDLERYVSNETDLDARAFSMNQIREAKFKSIAHELVSITSSGNEVKSDQLLLYVFHTGDKGLKSEAEMHGQAPLPSSLKNSFLTHLSNNKLSNEQSAAPYNPFISATTNLEEFTNINFNPNQGGNTHTRLEIFGQHTDLSLCIAQRSNCHNPDLFEGILIDTSYNPINPIQTIANPFHGQIDVNPVILAASRICTKEEKRQASEIAERRLKIMPPEDVPLIITKKFVEDYKNWYEVKEKFCASLAKKPKKAIAKLSSLTHVSMIRTALAHKTPSQAYSNNIAPSISPEKKKSSSKSGIE